MTKLVRKLKQMAKKRSHRKQVQKRKAERIQRDLEREKDNEEEVLERETDLEMARLNGEETAEATVSKNGSEPVLNERLKRVIGGLEIEGARKKNRKQLSRKQTKRQAKLKERGEAINDMVAKKWDHKKRRVKVRAQVRNEDLHN